MSETTATRVSASGKTGGVCAVSGPYKSTRNPSVVVFFKRGDKFTPDPTDGRDTGWTM